MPDRPSREITTTATTSSPLGHLLTRNLEYQEGDFDPDPDAVAAGIAAHLRFLRDLGFTERE